MCPQDGEGMCAYVGWIIRVSSVMAFIGSFAAWVAIGFPDLRIWTLAALTYSQWQTIVDGAGVLGLLSLVGCGVMRIAKRQCFVRERLRWCIWMNLSAIALTLFIPCLAISERRARAEPTDAMDSR